MKIEEFVERARSRSVDLELSNRSGFVYLKRGGRWLPLMGIQPGEELPLESTRLLCEVLGLPPEDFELDPE